MSRFSYELSKRILIECDDFYALIMAAMRKADTPNRTLLMLAFPEVWDELQARYNAPGGVIGKDDMIYD